MYRLKSPIRIDHPIFALVFEIAKLGKLTVEEQEMYMTSLMKKWDYDNTIDYAKEEGIVIGIEKKAIDTAKRLKELGVEVDIIVKGTGLTKQQIEIL